MPDHWDTKPENLFSVPGEQPDPAPNSHHDRTNEIPLRDSGGRLRLPAYILIALVIAAAAILLVAAGLLLAPSWAHERRGTSPPAWPAGRLR